RLAIGLSPGVELGFRGGVATGEPRLVSGVVQEAVRGGAPGVGVDVRAASRDSGTRMVLAAGLGADRLRWSRHVLRLVSGGDPNIGIPARDEWDLDGRDLVWRGFLGGALWAPLDDHLTVEVGAAAQSHVTS